jgi:hypothetical protein
VDDHPTSQKRSMGRCFHCDCAYHWPKRNHLTLTSMLCPRCGSMLDQTTHNLRLVPWFALDAWVDENNTLLKARYKLEQKYKADKKAVRQEYREAHQHRLQELLDEGVEYMDAYHQAYRGLSRILARETELRAEFLRALREVKGDK